MKREKGGGGKAVSATYLIYRIKRPNAEDSAFLRSRQL